MLDLLTPKGRIIEAALKLAERKPWNEIVLDDVAREAGVPLVSLKESFTSKQDILAAFSRLVDDEVLRRVHLKHAQDEKRRDRLFDVIMTRFDVLAPYKTALRSIIESPSLPSPAMLQQALGSQHWMLSAAGIGTEGPGGAVRVAGLASVYGRVMREWLDDSDPGHAKTMAMLDRRLRNGERWVRSLDDAASRVRGVLRSLKGMRRRRRDGDRDVEGGAEPNAAANI